jgi:nucleoside-diphosphate-sugar epimerase
MRCLITGAGGYLGSVLCPALIESGWTTIAVDLDLTSLVMCCHTNWFEPAKLSILDETVLPGLIEKVDAVVHLAGLVGIEQVDRQPELAERTMRQGTEKLLWWANGKPFIYPNTDAGYGSASSRYAQLKIAGEKMVLDAGGVSLRLGSVFGAAPRMRHSTLLNWLVQQAVQVGELALSQPEAKRTVLHVEDCALAIIHTLAHYGGMAGQAYDVALDAYTKQRLCLKIQQQLPEFKWTVDEAAYTDQDARDFEPDSGKLAATGFRPANSVEYGVRELIKVYKL